MAQIYTILAYSPSKNQTQREFDEDSLKGRHTTDRKLALQKAQAFAQRMNTQQVLGATDWQPRIEFITTLI
jgi:predicted house-cleaning NTP pyrophosphatase (Maf/HAM1 superfamily)